MKNLLPLISIESISCGVELQNAQSPSSSETFHQSDLPKLSQGSPKSTVSYNL